MNRRVNSCTTARIGGDMKVSIFCKFSSGKMVMWFSHNSVILGKLSQGVF